MGCERFRPARSKCKQQPYLKQYVVVRAEEKSMKVDEHMLKRDQKYTHGMLYLRIPVRLMARWTVDLKTSSLQSDQFTD